MLKCQIISTNIVVADDFWEENHGNTVFRTQPTTFLQILVLYRIQCRIISLSFEAADDTCHAKHKSKIQLSLHVCYDEFRESNACCTPTMIIRTYEQLSLPVCDFPKTCCWLSRRLVTTFSSFFHLWLSVHRGHKRWENIASYYWRYVKNTT